MILMGFLGVRSSIMTVLSWSEIKVIGQGHQKLKLKQKNNSTLSYSTITLYGFCEFQIWQWQSFSSFSLRPSWACMATAVSAHPFAVLSACCVRLVLVHRSMSQWPTLPSLCYGAFQVLPFHTWSRLVLMQLSELEPGLRFCPWPNRPEIFEPVIRPPVCYVPSLARRRQVLGCAFLGWGGTEGVKNL